MGFGLVLDLFFICMRFIGILTEFFNNVGQSYPVSYKIPLTAVFPEKS